MKSLSKAFSGRQPFRQRCVARRRLSADLPPVACLCAAVVVAAAIVGCADDPRPRLMAATVQTSFGVAPHFPAYVWGREDEVVVANWGAVLHLRLDPKPEGDWLETNLKASEEPHVDIDEDEISVSFGTGSPGSQVQVGLTSVRLPWGPKRGGAFSLTLTRAAQPEVVGGPSSAPTDAGWCGRPFSVGTARRSSTSRPVRPSPLTRSTATPAAGMRAASSTTPPGPRRTIGSSSRTTTSTG